MWLQGRALRKYTGGIELTTFEAEPAERRGAQQIARLKLCIATEKLHETSKNFRTAAVLRFPFGPISRQGLLNGGGGFLEA